MNKKANSGLKIICLNRKARFNYFFEDLIEAGIVLKGSEIKLILFLINNNLAFSIFLILLPKFEPSAK